MMMKVPQAYIYQNDILAIKEGAITDYWSVITPRGETNYNKLHKYINYSNLQSTVSKVFLSVYVLSVLQIL
jgi:hypothetical protein